MRRFFRLSARLSRWVVGDCSSDALQIALRANSRGAVQRSCAVIRSSLSTGARCRSCALLGGERGFGRVGGVGGSASARLAPFPPPSPRGSCPPSPVGAVAPRCGLFPAGGRGFALGPRSLAVAVVACIARALPRAVWVGGSALRCAGSAPCRAPCAPASPVARVGWWIPSPPSAVGNDGGVVVFCPSFPRAPYARQFPPAG